MLGATFNLQGHRGARGLQPENTLPSFEIALDVGVTSIETDLHLSREGHVIVCHDAVLSADMPWAAGGAIPLVALLTLAELRQYTADVNPDPTRFPQQKATPTPAAAEFARARGLEPFGLPTLDELFAFVRHYAQSADKTPEQRRAAARLVFDLELKCVPGRPELVGDLVMFQERVLQCIERHRVLDRTVVRSFDHQCIWALKQRELRLRTAVLIAGTAPMAPEALARRTAAQTYCPDVDFLDEQQVRQLHAASIAVLPWTVNEPEDWSRLLAWGVDGITTDYPDRLAQFLHNHGMAF